MIRAARSVRRVRGACGARRMQRGVTLIELIVALGLAAALLGAVIVFVSDLAESRTRIERLSTRDRAIDAFMEVVEGAVATSVLDAVDGALAGDSRSCTIRSATVDPAPAIALDGRPFVPTTVTWFGFESGAGALQVRRGTGATESLPTEAYAMRLRYHDGRAWVDTFDAREHGRLPTAIEVSVWLSRPISDGAELSATGDDEIEPSGPPDRQRIIAVPDAAPAELLPDAPRRST